MKLENGQNLQDHLKVFVELFEELAIIGDAMEEKKRMIILLSLLPDGFSTLVTALEAHEKIPAWEVVTERLLNEGRRQRGGPGTSDSSEKLLVLLSRDVVFNESQFMSFEKEPSKEIECVPWSFPQEEKHEDSEGELELRRSTRNRAAPDRFGGWVFGIDKANSVATPVDVNADLVTTSDEVEECDKDLYQSAVEFKTGGPMVVNEDNQSAICLAQNPKYHGRSKLIDIKFHYVRDLVRNEEIDLVYCPSNDMLVDIFTKGLSAEKFSRLRSKLGVVSFEKHIQSEKEC
ncbi:hypothetical protein FHG87_018904 [Trinorchestia longiramus]|nr:hypothetical protein FHG87_018904 [Trinorchestia longiramus]